MSLFSPPLTTKSICKLFTPSFIFILLKKRARSAQTMGTKTLLLGLVVAALAVAAAQASVTIYNPAGLSVDVLVDDKNVKVTTEMVTVDITQAQQYIQLKDAEGEVVEVNVQEGDVLVLIPDPNDPLHAVQALKIQVGAAELLTPPKQSPLPELESTPNPQVESNSDYAPEVESSPASP